MIRLSKSCLSHLEKSAVMKVLDKEYLGMGEEVQEFEKALTSFFGRPAVCVSSGTAALHLALQAVGINNGDEVLVQSLTYVASFQAISATGATPIACDIDPDTLWIDLKDAESKLTQNTKAIMPVHYSGGVGNLEQVYVFADRHGLRVIEDAAHAFGTNYMGKKVGGFGDIACFSFDGIKNITSGEGGCIVTNDNNILQTVCDARLLGVKKDTEKRYLGERSWKFDVSEQGWRYHMNNIMAAIGIVQLDRFEDFSRKRRELAIRYDELLTDSNINPIQHNYNEVVPHIYVVRLPSGVDRNNVEKQLLRKGIQSGVHYQPNHWLTKYKKNDKLQVTDDQYSNLLTLPLHPDIEINDVEYVCDNLLRACQ